MYGIVIAQNSFYIFEVSMAIVFLSCVSQSIVEIKLTNSLQLQVDKIFLVGFKTL